MQQLVKGRLYRSGDLLSFDLLTCFSFYFFNQIVQENPNKMEIVTIKRLNIIIIKHLWNKKFNKKRMMIQTKMMKMVNFDDLRFSWFWLILIWLYTSFSWFFVLEDSDADSDQEESEESEEADNEEGRLKSIWLFSNY